MAQQRLIVGVEYPGQVIRDSAQGITTIPRDNGAGTIHKAGDIVPELGVVLQSQLSEQSGFVTSLVSVARFGGLTEISYKAPTGVDVGDFLFNGVKVTKGRTNMRVIGLGKASTDMVVVSMMNEYLDSDPIPETMSKKTTAKAAQGEVI